MVSLESPFRYHGRDLRDVGFPTVDMFATVHNTQLPQFMSPIPDRQALAVDAVSQPWQTQSVYMFPPFSLLNKVIQKLGVTQDGEIILIVPWWPSQPCFTLLIQPSVYQPRILPYRQNLLSQPGYISDRCSHATLPTRNPTRMDTS